MTKTTLTSDRARRRAAVLLFLVAFAAGCASGGKDAVAEHPAEVALRQYLVELHLQMREMPSDRNFTKLLSLATDEYGSGQTEGRQQEPGAVEVSEVGLVIGYSRLVTTESDHVELDVCFVDDRVIVDSETGDVIVSGYGKRSQSQVVMTEAGGAWKVQSIGMSTGDC